MVIYWLKKDLRFQDNGALNTAIATGEKVLALYIFEPMLYNDAHYSERHFDFIKQSLVSLNDSLFAESDKILCLEGDAVTIFTILIDTLDISGIYSTQEIGIDITFTRDKQLSKLFKKHKILWAEAQYNGVLRGIKNRLDWRKRWYDYMKAPIPPIDPAQLRFSIPKEIRPIVEKFCVVSLVTTSPNFQAGGRRAAISYKDSFFKERIAQYTVNISKPELSQSTCGRLSPYFAWGVLSIREVFQEAIQLKNTGYYKKQLSAFTSRLRWQSHFIQKFESEPRMEFEAVNKAFKGLNYILNEHVVIAWKEGKTGFPLVDACMRCVRRSGYLNFRMRAMVTSFLTHHLFQHFSTGSAWLAAQFLDFEPGIHYGQFQMQAGLTGTNTVRVYNPVKNALDHDPEAVFIKKWVPELAVLPTQFALEPWLLTPLEQALYSFEMGVDYPVPIVDHKATRAAALAVLYGQRKSSLAQTERVRILERHTIRNPAESDDVRQI